MKKDKQMIIGYKGKVSNLRKYLQDTFGDYISWDYIDLKIWND